MVPLSVSCWDVSTNGVVKRGLLVISEIPRQMGEVPERWKKANISPIFRKGKKEDPGNCRPTSQELSVPGKVMDRWKWPAWTYKGNHP